MMRFILGMALGVLLGSEVIARPRNVTAATREPDGDPDVFAGLTPEAARRLPTAVTPPRPDVSAVFKRIIHPGGLG